MGDFWEYFNSQEFNVQMTWISVYVVGMVALVTSVYMAYLRPRGFVDWAYAYFMFALAMVVARIIYAVRLNPQLGEGPTGKTALWGSLLWINLALAGILVVTTLATTGWQKFRKGETT